MKKLMIVAAGLTGAAYARRRREQRLAERDLHAAATAGMPPRSRTGDPWAASTDRPAGAR